MRDMLSKQIRISLAIPSDMQPGEYLFLEKRGNKKWLKQMYIL